MFRVTSTVSLLFHRFHSDTTRRITPKKVACEFFPGDDVTIHFFQFQPDLPGRFSLSALCQIAPSQLGGQRSACQHNAPTSLPAERELRPTALINRTGCGSAVPVSQVPRLCAAWRVRRLRPGGAFRSTEKKIPAAVQGRSLPTANVHCRGGQGGEGAGRCDAARYVFLESGASGLVRARFNPAAHWELWAKENNGAVFWRSSSSVTRQRASVHGGTEPASVHQNRRK